MIYSKNLDYIPVFGNKKDFEDEYIVNQIEKIFIKKRGYTFKLPRQSSSIILSLSGGIDSICLWNLLLGKYKYHVYPVHFFFGEEIRSGAFKAISFFSTFFKESYPNLFHDVFFINRPKIFSFFDLKNKKTVIRDLATFVPNLIYDPSTERHHVSLTTNPARFGSYVFGAYEYAYKLKFEKGIAIDTIYLGIIPENLSVTRESTLATLRSVNLFFCTVLGDFRWQFTGPIEKKNNFFYTKQDLILNALSKKLPLEKTYSCDWNSRIHCGKCPSCFSRRTVFKVLKIKDDTVYKTSSK